MPSQASSKHQHSFRPQRTHVRAAYASGPEVNNVARAEPCVVEQRLDVAKGCVVVEPEGRQAGEPTQRVDIADRLLAANGSFVSLSATNSSAPIKPTPRASPTRG